MGANNYDVITPNGANATKNGHPGGQSSNAMAIGSSHFTFDPGGVDGTWNVFAESGKGGSGGAGSAGGDSGVAKATLNGETIVSGPDQGVTISITAEAGAGGAGGAGFNGGPHGAGGNSGYALAEFATDTFNVAYADISADATVGGAGIGGGSGGAAYAEIVGNHFNLQPSDTTTELDIELSAQGGNGGDGRSPYDGGTGGLAEAAFSNNKVIGGSEDDIVTVVISNVIGGLGGNNLDDTVASDGAAIAQFAGNKLDGGLGNNTLQFFRTGVGATDYAVNVDLSLHTIVFHGDGGDTTSSIKNFQNVSGGDGDDVLTGDSHANKLAGDAGNDTLVSSSGGGDTFSGGPGDDTFVFKTGNASPAAAPDKITDLGNTDTIDLSALATDLVLVPAFDGHMHEVTLSYNSSANVTVMSVYLTHSSSPTLVVDLSGDHSDFTNFVL